MEQRIAQTENVCTIEEVKAEIEDGTIRRITKAKFDELNSSSKINLSSRKQSAVWRHISNVVYTNSYQPVLANIKAKRDNKRWVYCLKCLNYDQLIGMRHTNIYIHFCVFVCLNIYRFKNF